MATNDQYDPDKSRFFGMQPGSSTGAPGTPGQAADAPGADLASVPVSPVYESSQVPAPRVLVDSGDSGTPGVLYEGISGEGPGQTASTGAGMGSVSTPHHPNAAGQ